MSRYITIELADDIPDDEYANLANMLWPAASMATDSFVMIYDDGKTSITELNKSWFEQGGWVDGVGTAVAPEGKT